MALDSLEKAMERFEEYYFRKIGQTEDSVTFVTESTTVHSYFWIQGSYNETEGLYTFEVIKEETSQNRKEAISRRVQNTLTPLPDGDLKKIIPKAAMFLLREENEIPDYVEPGAIKFDGQNISYTPAVKSVHRNMSIAYQGLLGALQKLGFMD